ncbi:MAG: glycosyltransferase [Ignavibacteria bacterium]|nr:glycosyltransferase [Ignavibacteria bacterium]
MLKFFTQPIKNISLARNVSVAEAKGEYILIIDDDEIASSEWISHLHNVLFKYNADAVFGRVVSYFESDTPDWIKKCFIYNRPTYKTGTRAISLRTGNVMVKTSILRSIEGPFDPVYGITGGSDSKLFSVLRKINNLKYINSYEAVTYEFVPAERSKVKWLIIRAFRTGNNFFRRQIEYKKKGRLSLRLKFLIVGFGYSVIRLLLIVLFIFTKTKSLNWIVKFASNCGKVAAVFGYHPIAYGLHRE